jgi:putative tryptophan/tyrosine transport system substrate-binding protein
MRRRDFALGLAGSAAAWPLVARAQTDRPRLIGVLMSTAEGDEQSIARYTAFLEGLRTSGWIDGHNMRINARWSAGDVDRARKYAGEILALTPDVIMVSGALSLEALLHATRIVPIVFALVTDPVGAGFVDSLSRPGGNVTGFMAQEYSVSGKWLQLLKEIAPNVTKAGVLRAATLAADIGQFAVIESVAGSVGAEPSPINVLDPTEIERTIAAFARSENAGLVVLPSPFTVAQRDLIIALAARYKMPAVYPERFFAKEGGLISYGPDFLQEFRSAAGYVDRILRSEKPADLPVQAPTHNELVINLKTAKALGLTVPISLLARADEVFE